jgi:hypothetical protein
LRSGLRRTEAALRPRGQPLELLSEFKQFGFHFIADDEIDQRP